MSQDDVTDLTSRLSDLLPGNPEVRVTGVASLGAQRRTLFLDLEKDGKTKKAVAQIASQVLESGNVANEIRLLRAAERAGVAVPRILADDVASGTVVSEHVAGESIPRRVLRLVEADGALGARLARDCGTAMAQVHRIPTDEFRDLQDLTNPARYADEMERLLETLTAPHPTFRLGVRWLRQNKIGELPTPAVVHGDFRLGNFLASDRGVTAVLDWEIVHLGDPMEDLAWLCLRTWRFGADELEVGGFGSIDELRSAYEKASGVWRDDAFAWWTVARTLWWGLGLARQTQVFIQGGATSIVLAASGRRVVELEYDLLQLMEEADA
jgi:aminoglycoside phosphotransferase (APT) family kinase protein